MQTQLDPNVHPIIGYHSEQFIHCSQIILRTNGQHTKKLQTHKQFSLDMIMELLLRSQKFKTAETCDANSFPADSPIKRSLSLISTASAKRTVSKYHNKRQIQKDNPEAIFDFFQDVSWSQWISMRLFQHPMEAADDVFGAEWSIKRSKAMIWAVTTTMKSRRLERCARSVPRKTIIAFFATITLWRSTVNDVMY